MGGKHRRLPNSTRQGSAVSDDGSFVSFCLQAAFNCGCGIVCACCRPDPSDYARVARWLVHRSDWGTVSTQSTSLAGFPYGYAEYWSTISSFEQRNVCANARHMLWRRNAVAISDGPLDRSTGRIFFYLTDFDQTAVDLAVKLHDKNCCFSCSCLEGWR